MNIFDYLQDPYQDPGSATAIPLGQAPNPISSTGETSSQHMLTMNYPTGNPSGDDPFTSGPQNPGSGQKDMSAFAGYGMTPPPIPDPMTQMKSLMSMNQPPQQKQQQPMGSLMSYLQQLGAI